MAKIDNQPGEQKREHLGIELDVMLQLQLRGAKDVWKSTLVGFVREQYLIVSIPQIPGLWVKLHQQNHIIVRYVHRGKVYGFYTTLVGTMDEPFRLAFLAYPENIEVVNLRRFERTPCMIPAQLSIEGLSCKGVFTDVSPGGCSFLFDQSVAGGSDSINVGDEVAFSVQLIGSPEARTINAVIKNIRVIGKKISLGTQFRNPDDGLLHSIKIYVDNVSRFDIV